MANHEPKVTDLGNSPDGKGSSVLLIDPNPPGNGIIPPEDLFMYVKLRAIKRNRSVIESDGGTSGIGQTNVDGEINFIATEVVYGDDGKTPTNRGETYATTSFTDIGGINNNSSGSLEGFGINSINITYGASLVPQVDMSFVDLRGASLFDVIDSDNRKTPYSIFFTMPYPVFELTVKGYFGKAVTYCLHMTKWTSDFDGSTGNFNIKANFVGFQQAFLADMVLGNIIGVTNTQEGTDALSNINIKNSDGTTTPTPKLDDFINEITKLPLRVDAIKDNDEEFQQLKNTNSKITLLKKIKTFIGSPISKDPLNPERNSPTAINSGDLSRGWFESKDSEVIRDLVVIKENRRVRFLEYAEKAFELIGDYRKFIFDHEKGREGVLPNFIFDKDIDNKMLWSNEIFTESRFRDVYDKIQVPSGNLLAVDLPFSKRWSIDNFEYRILADNRVSYIGPNKFSESGEEKVFVVDFFEMRREIQQLYDDEITTRDNKQETVLTNLNRKLKENLDFNPTIKDVISIIMNNTQAMIQAIHTISVAAEKNGIKRGAALAKQGIISDSLKDPQSETTKIYAWPEIFQEETEKRTETTKKWLGDIFADDSDAKNLFPEIAFVEQTIDGFLSSTNRIKKTKDVVSKIVKDKKKDGFYPFYPGDEKPRYNSLNFQPQWDETSNHIPVELIKILLDSPFIIDSNSGYGENIVDFANLEAAHLCLTLINDVHKNVIHENLTPEIVYQYGIDNNLIIESGDVVSTTTGVYLTGDKEKNYIVLESNPEYYSIVNNITPIDDTIKTTYSNNITNIRKYKNNDPKTAGIKYFNDGYKLPTHDITFLVWGQEIKNKIVKPSTDKLDSSYVFTIKDLQTIDKAKADTGESANTYIGVLNKTTKLITSSLYSGQTDEGKALLLLNTLPFDNPKEIIPLLQDKAKVVKLPKYYVLWLAGTLWRSKISNNLSSNDPIITTGSEIGTIAINSFLYWHGSSRVYGDNHQIPAELTALNEKTKDGLINYFLEWVNKGGFNSLETNIAGYTDTIVNSGSVNITFFKLLTQLKEVVSFISVSPNIWKPSYGAARTTKQNINNYLNQFITSFKKACDFAGYWKSLDELVDKRAEPQISNNKDLKIVLYGYFKNIYDKWIGGTENGLTYNICGPSLDRDLMDYFKFINRAWCDIGDEAVVNLDSVTTLSSDYKSNIYFFLAKILRDSNFLLQILPSYINFKDPKEVVNMFKPISTVDSHNAGPIYVCIQAGGASKVLDLPKTGNNSYRPDTVVFDGTQSLPAEFTGCKKPSENSDTTYGLVAFRVAFGAQNQSIFKSVSLNQEEHRETGEYFAALTQLVDKRGGTQRINQGTDLYPIFQTRSYTAKIDALGCMNIQPLMYFQLDNVPFFHGAYLITNVQHSISPNHITTNFSGVRQSNTTIPLITNTTTFLNIDLNEEFDNVEVDTTPPERVSINFGVSNPDARFVWNNLQVRKSANGQPTRGILDQLKIYPTDADNVNIDTLFTDVDFATTPDANLLGNNTPFAKILITNGILSNSQVTMFLSNLIGESNHFYDRNEIWNDPMVDTNGVAQQGTPTQKDYEKSTKLGNTETGDGYKYLGRGYIKARGRTSYSDMNSDTTLKNKLDKGTFTNINLIDNPDIISLTQNNLLETACWLWNNNKVGGKTLNEIAKGGNGTTFEIVSRELSSGGDTIKKKISTFENILSTLPGSSTDGNLKDPLNI